MSRTIRTNASLGWRLRQGTAQRRTHLSCKDQTEAAQKYRMKLKVRTATIGRCHILRLSSFVTPVSSTFAILNKHPRRYYRVHKLQPCLRSPTGSLSHPKQSISTDCGAGFTRLRLQPAEKTANRRHFHTCHPETCKSRSIG
jgi:hypothetical protein